jgi:hypothetical protein
LKLWLLVLVAALSAGSARAAGPIAGKLETRVVEPVHFTRSFSLRAVLQESSDLSRIQRSGMIAQTGVATNMQLGVGLFSVKRNRLSSMEPKTDVRAKPSRKLGLSFNWRF